ncbi:MAG: hypothetical protein ABH833_01135 [Parcubacteria group bacterium]
MDEKATNRPKTEIEFADESAESEELLGEMLNRLKELENIKSEHKLSPDQKIELSVLIKSIEVLEDDLKQHDLITDTPDRVVN